MPSIIEYFQSKISSKPIEPKSSIYDVRIKCFQTLAELQKNIQSADEEYLTVSSIEGKAHHNAWKHMEVYTAKYRLEYHICEKIMKY